MLSLIRYRWNLFKLEQKRKKLYEEHCVGDPRDFNPADLTSCYASGVAWACEGVEDEIAELQLEYLRPIAQRLMVQVPEASLAEDGQWRYSERIGRYVLQPSALHSLWKNIEQARKDRRMEFVQWLTALTGLIGAATGLAAILMQ